MASGALRHSNSSSTTPPFYHRPTPLHHPAFSLRFPPSSPRLPPLRVNHPRRAPDRSDGDGGGRERKERRRWWSDGMPEETSPGLWEEFVDNMWFFKVLQPYGWMLPFIVLPLLLESGPKAFLMASSVPFGLSVMTFAVRKLFGLAESSSEYKPVNQKRTRPTNKKNPMNEEDDDFDFQRKSKRRTRGSANSSGATGFGGWDDL